MARNLDLTALRSFVAVAEAGKVTAAAGRLNLTQSAVSMQMKRLEESLGRALFDRAGRGVALTAEGELLLGYARRMVALNDEIRRRLTHEDFEGELILGVPHDIVYPCTPRALRRFNREFPRIRVSVVSSLTRELREQFERGGADLILTTESRLDAGGETLQRTRLVWVGAPGGCVWRERPLRLAYERGCLFRPMVQAALDDAEIPWRMMVDSEQSRAVEAVVSADLAVHAQIAGSVPPHLEVIDHGGALPELSPILINMYLTDGPKRRMVECLAAVVREAYGLPPAVGEIAAE